MNKTIFTVVILFILSASLALAIPATWYGYAYLDGSLAPNGTNVTAYINGGTTVAGFAVVGTVADAGYYIIHVPTTDPTAEYSGSNVTFKVGYNIVQASNGSNSSAQLWNLGEYILNLSANKTATSAACTVAEQCAGGYCVHSICRTASTYCGDGTCDAGESCTDDCGGGGGSSSSGGGGGSSTTAATTTATSQTFYFSITGSGTKQMTITQAALSFTELILVSTGSVSGGTVKIIEWDKNPVTLEPEGTSYSFVEIQESNIANDLVASVKIKFKIKKAWLTEHGFERSEIYLARYDGTKWVKLVTAYVSQDSDGDYHYEATSPGLSYFAIMGLKAAQPAAPVGGNVTGDEIEPSAGTNETPPLPQPPGEKPDYISAGLIILLIFAVAAIFVSVHNKRKRHHYKNVDEFIEHEIRGAGKK